MTKIIKRKIATPLSIRNRAQEYAARPEPQEISKGRRGATIGNLTNGVKRALFSNTMSKHDKIKLTKEQRESIDGHCRLVVSWLFLDPADMFVPTSRTVLTPQQIHALGRWNSEYKGEYPDGQWVERSSYLDELQWVLYWAGLAYKRTVESTMMGDELTFGEILEQYKIETIAGENEPDHWELTTNAILAGEVKPEYPDKVELPDGAVWCEWCGEYPSSPGTACKSCVALGAPESAQISENDMTIRDAPKSPQAASKRAADAFAGLFD